MISYPPAAALRKVAEKSAAQQALLANSDLVEAVGIGGLARSCKSQVTDQTMAAHSS